MDTYDLKPDAPVEYRGEFKPIQTNVPGMDICELMPLQAKIADKFAIIRNMKFQQQGHTPRSCIPASSRAIVRRSVPWSASSARTPAFTLPCRRTSILATPITSAIPVFSAKPTRRIFPAPRRRTWDWRAT